MTPIREFSAPSDQLSLENEQLRARIGQLEAEREAMDGFVAMAAHELLAPLIVTEACAASAGERLQRGDGEDVLASLDVLGRGAMRTRRLVESLLHEVSARSLPFEPKRVELHALADECITMLRPEIDARECRISVGPLPAVSGEAALLGGVFTNLLANALKFSPRHGAEIRMGATRDAGADWRIFVESEGPPIPELDRERIFEPFQRGRSERRTRGAGLGLSICRRIVERHGGRIGVEPSPAGNRFYFTLPA